MMLAAVLFQGASGDTFQSVCLASGGSPGVLLASTQGRRVVLVRTRSPVLAEISFRRAPAGSTLTGDILTTPVSGDWSGAVSGSVIDFNAPAGPIVEWCLRTRPMP
ncbi:MAG: hypothetical protein ACK4RV_13295 [Caulobacter sp.]